MKKIILLIVFLVFGFSLVIYANKNEDAAKQYCKDMISKNPDYKCKVSKWRGCGSGWTMDKAFRGGGEKDYYACKWTKYHAGTEEHKKKAEADCDKIRKEGKKCKVSQFLCGKGWVCVKRYTGTGKNALVCVPGDTSNHGGGFNDVIVHKSNPNKKEAERKDGVDNRKAK
jgi:hypothetical protein